MVEKQRKMVDQDKEYMKKYTRETPYTMGEITLNYGTGYSKNTLNTATFGMFKLSKNPYQAILEAIPQKRVDQDGVAQVEGVDQGVDPTATLKSLVKTHYANAAALNNYNRDSFGEKLFKSAPKISPIQKAARNGQLECVKILAAQPGVDINKRFENCNYRRSNMDSDYVCEPALHLAVINGYLDIVKFLCQPLFEGIITDIFATDTVSGNNILHLAAEHGHLNIVKYILGILTPPANFINTLNDDKINISKRTALFIASIKGHVDIVKYLLEKGADPSIKGQLPGRKNWNEHTNGFVTVEGAYITPLEAAAMEYKREDKDEIKRQIQEIERPAQQTSGGKKRSRSLKKKRTQKRKNKQSRKR